jgi:hypothetical protein
VRRRAQQAGRLMQFQVVHVDVGKAVVKRAPVRAAVRGLPHADFGADIHRVRRRRIDLAMRWRVRRANGWETCRSDLTSPVRTRERAFPDVRGP